MFARVSLEIPNKGFKAHKFAVTWAGRMFSTPFERSKLI